MRDDRWRERKKQLAAASLLVRKNNSRSRATFLSLQKYEDYGVEYTRRRKENTQGARETPLAQVGLNVQVTNRVNERCDEKI